MKLALPTKSRYDVVQINNIIYLAASGNYCIAITDDGNRSNVYKPLKYFSDLLEDNFLPKIHHEYLINLRQQLKYNKIDGGLAGGR
ncbi:MAG: LytTR family transcriptional regulator DNA-binding domain-containing protein [Saprospiraceae bacterium]|nr:LytTR family transcriptional regulator DNA-binding domain-containing protein [Saprospiraceae bacterium]